MRRTLTFLAALTLAAGLASAASAQKLDVNGKCHAADGKFAKAEVCAAAKPVKCRDAKGKFMKCPVRSTHSLSYVDDGSGAVREAMAKADAEKERQDKEDKAAADKADKAAKEPPPSPSPGDKNKKK